MINIKTSALSLVATSFRTELQIVAAERKSVCSCLLEFDDLTLALSLCSPCNLFCSITALAGLLQHRLNGIERLNSVVTDRQT